jgi:hypothetical protein
VLLPPSVATRAMPGRYGIVELTWAWGPSGGVSEDDELRRKKGGSSAQQSQSPFHVRCAIGPLTVNKCFIALLGVVVGVFEPSAGVAAFSRAVLVRYQFRRDTRWIGLVTCRIRDAQHCRLTLGKSFTTSLFSWRAVSKRDRLVRWDAARMASGGLPGYGTWELGHARDYCTYRTVDDGGL